MDNKHLSEDLTHHFSAGPLNRDLWILSKIMGLSNIRIALYSGINPTRVSFYMNGMPVTKAEHLDALAHLVSQGADIIEVIMKQTKDPHVKALLGAVLDVVEAVD